MENDTLILIIFGIYFVVVDVVLYYFAMKADIKRRKQIEIYTDKRLEEYCHGDELKMKYMKEGWIWYRSVIEFGGKEVLKEIKKIKV